MQRPRGYDYWDEPRIAGVGAIFAVSDRAPAAEHWAKCHHCGEETLRERPPIGFRARRREVMGMKKGKTGKGGGKKC